MYYHDSTHFARWCFPIRCHFQQAGTRMLPRRGLLMYNHLNKYSLPNDRFIQPTSNLSSSITGAAGRIGYSFVPLILNGSIFGNKKVHLKLFDIPECMDKLLGIKMEIEDSNYAALESLVVSANVAEAFTGVEVAVLIGGYPRLPGMERRDLLVKNADSIKSQALALNQYGNAKTKVLVVANPANTNTLVAIKSAPNIPPENFTCLTRLDHERLRGFCAAKATESVGYPIHSRDVRNVFIFGNHSTTQVAYIGDGQVATKNGDIPTAPLFADPEEFKALLSKLQQRGAAIIKALQVSSAMSAAEAIAKHLRDWLGPVLPTQPFSMGILSDGNSYGVPQGLVYSFPCVRRTLNGPIEILDGLPISSEVMELMLISAVELEEEKRMVANYVV